MKIGIDARLIDQTGVGVYIRNLLISLDKIAEKDIEFIVFMRTQDLDKINFTSNQFKKVAADFQWHSLSEQIGFLKLLENSQLDLMHFTYFSYPIRYKRRFITTIHDLTHLHFKSGKASTRNPLIYGLKHAAFQYILKKQIENSSAIIAPSNTVKLDIEKTFGSETGKKITVIYEGLNTELLNVSENLQLKTRFPKPFFLYVGNFYPHKNVPALIAAFAQTKTAAQLVLVGPNDYFMKSIQKQIKDLAATEKIIYFGQATTADLVFLYKHALALIHPSYSEGFGLPLIEAAYFGCPIIASNIDIFKEILDNHYLAFDPKSTYDIANKLTFFSESKSDITPPDKETLLNKFSFQNMAQQTHFLYKKTV